MSHSTASSGNVIDLPCTQSYSVGETILMTSQLLILFSRIQDDLTHLVAIEIIQQNKIVNEFNLAQKFNKNIFKIRRSILELIDFGLIKKCNDSYKLNKSMLPAKI
jgi:hypothetical protein